MFVDPKLDFNSEYAARFCRENHSLDYGSYSNNQLKSALVAGMDNYLARIKRGNLDKGTRPWEVVNVTQSLDAGQAWIGVEWETGFCSRAEYEGAVQWLWENHHNWAVDDEGIGPYRGEFTFPPVEFERFAAGDTIMDSMRQWMADNSIATPTAWNQILNSDGSPYRHYADPRDGWGCHVNISIPETRDNVQKTQHLSRFMKHIFTNVLDGNYNVTQDLFGRDPYGWGSSRSGTDGTSWIEWKLFHTPASDVEVETIRMVTLKLSELMRDVASNPTKYFPTPAEQQRSPYSNYVVFTNTINVPTAQDLRDWLLHDREDLPLHSTTRNENMCLHALARSM
jgi:hypothetical protein